VVRVTAGCGDARSPGRGGGCGGRANRLSVIGTIQSERPDFGLGLSHFQCKRHSNQSSCCLPARKRLGRWLDASVADGGVLGRFAWSSGLGCLILPLVLAVLCFLWA